MMRVVDYYNEMVYTYSQVEWDRLFQQAALGESVVAFGGNEEFFFENPCLQHVGLLTWETENATYVAVAKVSEFGGIEYLVTPVGVDTPYWKWTDNQYVLNLPPLEEEDFKI